MCPDTLGFRVAASTSLAYCWQQHCKTKPTQNVGAHCQEAWAAQFMVWLPFGPVPLIHKIPTPLHLYVTYSMYFEMLAVLHIHLSLRSMSTQLMHMAPCPRVQSSALYEYGETPRGRPMAA